MDNRLVFDSISEHFDKWRSHYTPELFDYIIKTCELGESKSCLELGPGSGQASEFAINAGCDYTAIEIGEHFTKMMIGKYGDRRNFHIINDDFEKHVFTPESFDLVYSAAAIQWIRQDIAYSKCFDILKSGGYLAMFKMQADYKTPNLELYKDIQKVYEMYFKPDTSYSCKFNYEAGEQYGFHYIGRKVFKGRRTYNADDYIEFIKTHSDHITIQREYANAFFGGIHDAIMRHGGKIEFIDDYVLDLYQKSFVHSYDNKEILEVAMQQSALDLHAAVTDFQTDKNVIVKYELGLEAKVYYKEPIACNFVSYGNNIVASVKDEYRDIVQAYIAKFTFYHCFEAPNMHWLDQRMREKGQTVCFMAEYWLPDLTKLKPLECAYPMKILTQEDFKDLYVPEWSNALCSSRKELDVLGVGAYNNGHLIGLAGCSADCSQMWQIGVDVLPAYRRQGIAAALTSTLASEILKRGKVPFYCCAWSNLKSARNAIKSGFRPAWAEMTLKPIEVVEEMNK